MVNNSDAAKLEFSKFPDVSIVDEIDITVIS